MTAIASTAAPTSPAQAAPASGKSQGGAEGFEALLALAGGETVAAVAPGAELQVSVEGAAEAAAQATIGAAQADAAAAQVAAALVAAMTQPPVQTVPAPADAVAADAGTVASPTVAAATFTLPAVDAEAAAPLDAEAAAALAALDSSAEAETTERPAPTQAQAAQAAQVSAPAPAQTQGKTPIAPAALAALPASPLPEAVVSVIGKVVAGADVAAQAEVPSEPAQVQAQVQAAVVAKPPEPKLAAATTTDTSKTQATLAAAHPVVEGVEADPDAEANAGGNGGEKAQAAAAAPAVAAETATAEAPVFTPAAPAAPTVAAAPRHAEAAVTPETVPHLTAEIAKKVEAKATRFDVVLTPEGLGRVEVQVEIAKDGKLSATLSFDNPQAANDLRHKAGELRQALSQAGFDVASNALKFDLSNSGGGQHGQSHGFAFQQGENGRRSFAGAGFPVELTEVLPPLVASDLPPGLRLAVLNGLDLRI